jgi:bifunctional non-homologous end joining protein LigD
VKVEATTTWVKPKLVAEVKFTEWTDSGEMRHPAFLGLREDKDPMDVVMEKEGRVRAK